MHEMVYAYYSCNFSVKVPLTHKNMHRELAQDQHRERLSMHAW
jgi:hypothetical protein